MHRAARQRRQRTGWATRPYSKDAKWLPIAPSIRRGRAQLQANRTSRHDRTDHARLRVKVRDTWLTHARPRTPDTKKETALAGWQCAGSQSPGGSAQRDRRSSPFADHRSEFGGRRLLALRLGCWLGAIFSAADGRRDASASSPGRHIRRQRDLRRMPPGEAELWHDSQHKHAMDHATEKSVLGDFSDATFDYYGVRSRFFRKDGKFLVETDGPDGKLATFEVKYTFGVDPLQQYLIEFPDGRLQALSIAWDSRPKDKGGQRWFHLYPERGDPSRRRPALDQAEPELELHVRRVPFDRRAQELRCSERSICHALRGDQRRLRGLPRAGLAARRLGAGPAKSWWPFGKTDDPAKGLIVRFDERERRHLAARSEDRQAAAQHRARHAAQGGRDLRAVPRAPRPVLRELGARADGCRKRTWSRRSAAGSIMPTGRCSTRSTTTAHSSRARCSRPASPAAIATSRMAPSFARRATASACNATPPTSMRRRAPPP